MQSKLLSKSSHFEKQIERIHQLIEGPGAIVTWNDRLPDPDDPKQQRQIDITVKHEDKLTLIECRIHKERQDVQWIEELIGRRVSLKADCVVGVSACGFTSGALNKAKAHGIVLRDLISLTDQEIASWGRCANVSLTFLKFLRMKMVFRMDKRFVPRSIVEEVKNYMNDHPDQVFGAIQILSEQFDSDKKLINHTATVECELSIDKPWVLNSANITGINFNVDVREYEQKLITPVVKLYDSPNVVASERNISIQELEHFEITRSGNKVIFAMDLGNVRAPLNCIFRTVNVDMGESVLFTGVSIVRPPLFGISLQEVEIGLIYDQTISGAV